MLPQGAFLTTHIQRDPLRCGESSYNQIKSQRWWHSSRDAGSTKKLPELDWRCIDFKPRSRLVMLYFRPHSLLLHIRDISLAFHLHASILHSHAHAKTILQANEESTFLHRAASWVTTQLQFTHSKTKQQTTSTLLPSPERQSGYAKQNQVQKRKREPWSLLKEPFALVGKVIKDCFISANSPLDVRHGEHRG